MKYRSPSPCDADGIDVGGGSRYYLKGLNYHVQTLEFGGCAIAADGQ